MQRIEDRYLAEPAGDLPIRCYFPTVGAVLPALVYFHGGGFVAGDTVLPEAARVIEQVARALRLAFGTVGDAPAGGRA